MSRRSWSLQKPDRWTRHEEGEGSHRKNLPPKGTVAGQGRFTLLRRHHQAVHKTKRHVHYTGHPCPWPCGLTGAWRLAEVQPGVEN